MIRFNGWLADHILLWVGSMAAAYVLFLLALISLPAAVKSGSPLILVAWVSQTFLQLVLLPIILVGQNRIEVRDREMTRRDYELSRHFEGATSNLVRRIEVRELRQDDALLRLEALMRRVELSIRPARQEPPC